METTAYGIDLKLVFAVMIALIAFYILFIYFMRKSKKRKTSFMMYGMSMQDVQDMTRKGLLTEEEAKAVRATIARKTIENLEHAARDEHHGKRSLQEELLADIETVRAQQKEGKNTASAQGAEPPQK